MPKIDVEKPFLLTHEGGTGSTKFKAGVHDVDQHVADHWYVQAHLVGAKPKPAPGSPAFFKAEMDRAKAIEEKRLADEAEFEEALAAEERAKANQAMKDQIAVSQQELATASAAAVAKNGKAAAK